MKLHTDKFYDVLHDTMDDVVEAVSHPRVHWQVRTELANNVSTVVKRATQPRQDHPMLARRLQREL